MAKSKSIFTDQDMTVENYRSFSPFSLFAFILSAAVSLVALVNNGLMFLAGLGVIIAIISIVKLIQKQGRSDGYILSGLALAMPLFSIAAPMTYNDLRLRHLVTVASKHSEQWLDLIKEGNIHVPYELMQRRYMREDVGSDLTVALGDVQSPGKELEFYMRNQPEIAIREDGAAAKIVPRGLVNYEKDINIRGVEHFFVYYEYERPSGEKRRFRMRMQRQSYSDDKIFWSVAQVTNLTPKEKRFVYEAPAGDSQ